MKKHSFTSGSAGQGSGAAGRQNAVADYSGTGASRAFTTKPASKMSDAAGATHDDAKTELKGADGQPEGTGNSRFMSSKPQEFTQGTGIGQPLKNEDVGKAEDVVGTVDSGLSYAVAKPARKARHL